MKSFYGIVALHAYIFLNFTLFSTDVLYGLTDLTDYPLIQENTYVFTFLIYTFHVSAMSIKLKTILKHLNQNIVDTYS